MATELNLDPMPTQLEGTEYCVAGPFAARRPPRLLFVANLAPSKSSNPPVCSHLAARLERDGWSVAQTSRVRPRLGRLLDMAATTWRLRREYDIGHIEVFSGPAFAWAETTAFLVARAGKPYVLTLHGGRLPEFSRRHPLRVRRLLDGAAAVTAPSAYLIEALKDVRSDIELLPNPVELSRYRFRERRPAEPKLVWLRAFHPTYNPAMAVEAVAAVATKTNIELTMIGPDKGEGALERVRQTASRLGVRDLVRLPGPVAKGDVGKALDEGDIFLNTANVDNTPVSVIEAMACGMAVISTNVGGLPFLLEDGKDCLLVPAGDSLAMAEAIGRVLSDGDLAGRLSRNARRKAEGFGWGAVLPRWKQLLIQVNRDRR